MKLKIDFTSDFPLYRQIKNTIRQKIENLELKVGDLIPSENELESTLGISRAPIRQAISELVNEGYLVRRPGKGTFVSPLYGIKRDLPRLTSFTEEMKAQGLKPTSRILSVGYIERNEQSEGIFELLQDSRILGIFRLRIVNDKPICILYSYLPGKLGIHVEDDFSGSLYELLESKYKLTIMNGEEIITARVAEPQQAHLLEVPEGSALLTIQRTTFSSNHVPIELVKGFYRSDLFSFTINLHRHVGKSSQKLIHSGRGFTS